MTNFFYNLVVFFSYITPGHYFWVAIVLITVILRLAFMKPTFNMLKTQKKQKKVQGQLSEIKAKYKDDPKAQQEATMAIYKQEGINPLGSCLPLIIQMVLLYGFYQVFRMSDLSVVKPDIIYSFVPRPETLNTWFFGMDLTQTIAQVVKGPVGWVGYIFPVLTGGTQLIQSLQARSLQPVSEKGSKEGDFARAMSMQMTYFFPLITAYISYTLPSALSIYWITQTVFMVVQQYFIMKKFQDEEIVAEEV
ncbi:MAG: YidC/Oxa1 family membrane protein insertase, partial [Candidatus Omnitrophota bacterium]